MPVDRVRAFVSKLGALAPAKIADPVFRGRLWGL
jgi:hypothetical protein